MNDTKPRPKVLMLGDKRVGKMLLPDCDLVTPGNQKSNGKTGAIFYDAILCYHVLNEYTYQDGQNMLKMWLTQLRKDGEFHLFVPALEWAGEQILAEAPSPALPYHIWGNPLRPYKSGFLLADLRNLFESVGLAVVQAKSGEYEVNGNPAEQHYLLGIKK